MEGRELYKTEHLGHLGLVSCTIETLGLVKKINDRLPLDKSKGGKISHGHRTAAMILNGLGYLTRTLYLSPHFFEDKPLDLLLGIEVSAADFNDDMLGRLLDKIADYGTTKLFSELAFEICQEQGLLGKSYNLDSTTLTLYGDYERYEEASPLPLAGYSKDHRPDLKQVTLSLTQVSGSHMPLWMEALDGNSSDKKSFQETVQSIQKFQLALSQANDLFFVVDAAFYTPEKLAALSQVKWITRVPASYNAAKEVLNTPTDKLTLRDVGQGNKMAVMQVMHEDIKQRWVLVCSSQAKLRALQTFYKRLNKKFIEHNKALWHLSHTVFACQSDAEKAIGQFAKKLRHHRLDHQIIPVFKHPGKGRPKQGEEPSCVGYRCEGALSSDLATIAADVDCLGRFILATNELDENILADEEILSEYKGQTHVEAGFRFIKGDAFELNHVFLKNPNRIGALMMVMTLCLTVYNFAQQALRKTLEDEGTVIPNQVGKPIKNPTMRWVFQLMSKIAVICLWDEHNRKWVKRVSNVRTIQTVIIYHFGEHAKKIYGVPIDKALPEYDKNQKNLIAWCGM